MSGVWGPQSIIVPLVGVRGLYAKLASGAKLPEAKQFLACYRSRILDSDIENKYFREQILWIYIGQISFGGIRVCESRTPELRHCPQEMFDILWSSGTAWRINNFNLLVLLRNVPKLRAESVVYFGLAYM